MIKDDIRYCNYHVKDNNVNTNFIQNKNKFNKNTPQDHRSKYNNNNDSYLNNNNTFKNGINYYPNDWPQGRPGYIYIYTYKLLYESILSNDLNLVSWLQIDNSILLNNKDKKDNNYNNNNDNWSLNGMILCKIGMTTKKNVELRLDEWRQQCYHDIVNLTPININKLLDNLGSGNKKHGNNGNDKVKTLSRLFKMLNLKEHKKTKAERNTLENKYENNQKIKGTHPKITQSVPQLITYHQGGFYNDGQGKLNLLQIEDALHKLFWKKYGKGIIKCSGCYNGSLSDGKHKDTSINNRKKTYPNTRNHIEWFYVPIKDLPSIVMTIDNFCLSQTKTIPGTYLN